jgi:predicted RNase H-like HicB family nuclease
MNDRYSMVIRWSEADQAYIVSLPEFGDHAQTHGDSYAEAAQNGREVLDLLVESFQAEGRALPAPQLYEGSCSESARGKP